MNNVKHHLTDSLLMAYSAGTLPEAFNLIVAAHISMCDECRARAASFDSVGGALLEEAEAVAMDDSSFAETMRLITSGAMAPLPTPSRPAGKSVLPAPVRDYVGGDLDSVKWQSIGMGVKQSILPTSKDASIRLLYIPAGTAVPDHGHRGMELTLVLQGAFVDETDRFGPGDIEIADEELNHTPIADIGEDCICLAATDAPLRFNKLIPRIAQPFFRI
ncbi:MAG: ChrR family anti-sigma-E factor [Alphaproteobacteria bacterium]|nr:ChrR family anti-sigma-E factor [Paracoccaceae bacterium]